MERNTIEGIEEKLSDRRRAVADVMTHLEKERADAGDDRQLDWLDRAWDDSAARTIERLTQIYRGELEDIDAALVRIRAGAFGVCGACHAPIEAMRLKIFPQTRFCAACAGLREAFE